MIKKAEDSEADTAEQSAIKLRAQQQSSNALVVTDQRPVNGMPAGSQLGLVKVPVVVVRGFFIMNHMTDLLD